MDSRFPVTIYFNALIVSDLLFFPPSFFEHFFMFWHSKMFLAFSSASALAL